MEAEGVLAGDPGGAAREQRVEPLDALAEGARERLLLGADTLSMWSRRSINSG